MFDESRPQHDNDSVESSSNHSQRPLDSAQEIQSNKHEHQAEDCSADFAVIHFVEYRVAASHGDRFIYAH